MLTIFSAGGSRRTRIVCAAIAVGATAVLTPARSEAHFTLDKEADGGVFPDEPACWEDQDSLGSPQKNGPCAATPNPNLEPNVPPVLTHIVTAYQKGQTVSVTVTATIAHSGWFRIALVEGASSTQTITSLPDPPGTTCVPTKLVNPVWSPTQPVLADGLLTPPVTGGTETYQVALPATAICTTAAPCTLQVIMVMTDHTFPDCYYHHCADITITSLDGDGGGTSGSGTSGTSTSGTSTSGSTTSGASSGGADADAAAASGASSGTSSSGTTTSGSSDTGTSGSTTTSGTASGTSGSSNSGSASGSTSGTGGATNADASTMEGAPSASSGGCSMLAGTSGGLSGLGAAAFLALAAVRRKRRRA